MSRKKLTEQFRRLLSEDVPPEQPTNSRQFAPVVSDVAQNVSLDQKVDRYLIRYERESVPLGGQPLYSENTLRKHYDTLLEQDDDLDLEDDDFGDDDMDMGDDDVGGDDFDFDLGGGGGGDFDFGGGGFGGGGGGGGDLGGDEGGESGPGAPVMNTPRININEFARSVARLVNNYEALLDPRTTILNRAKLYVSNNYDARTAEELMQILELNYQLVPVKPTESGHTDSETEFPTPYATGAGVGGG